MRPTSAATQAIAPNKFLPTMGVSSTLSNGARMRPMTTRLTLRRTPSAAKSATAARISWVVAHRSRPDDADGGADCR
jgi:hypothetical protein